MNENEQVALENCLWLKSHLKDSNSFNLCDDIATVQLKPDNSVFDGYNFIVYIPYSGTNSYGATIESVAIFLDNDYLGDSNDSESDFSNQRDYASFIIAKTPYDNWTANNRANPEESGYSIVKASKIMRKMK